MPKPPTEGPQEYIMGWKAGCETGMTTYSNSYMRTKYQTNVDGRMMQNRYYNRGWELGQRYCSYYSSTYLSNKEFFKKDLRNDEKWFNLESDGFFNYNNATEISMSSNDGFFKW